MATFLERLKREFLNFIEFKGKEGRQRQMTWWDIGFTLLLVLLILGLATLFLYLGWVRP